MGKCSRKRRLVTFSVNLSNVLHLNHGFVLSVAFCSSTGFGHIQSVWINFFFNLYKLKVISWEYSMFDF